MTLTTIDFNDQLDLSPWVGQRSATFTFNHINGATGEQLGELHPVRNSAQLTHTTASRIKRQLNMTLDVADTVAVNPVTDRVEVAMVIDGVSYPLGRYMFTDYPQQITTGGNQVNAALLDEMFLVDQPMSTSFAPSNRTVNTGIYELLRDLPIDIDLDPTAYSTIQSWTLGTGRGEALEALSLSGDYFSPWFGNDGRLHIIKSFDPATQIPDFDFDVAGHVLRPNIIKTSDLLTAPNRFIVISSASENPGTPIYAIADIPPSAPHSIQNRGFVVSQVENLPVQNALQALAVATNLALRRTVFEKVTLSTPPDPRHDSYNVIRWQGANWLELSWSLSLTEGAAMTHTLRKAYA